VSAWQDWQQRSDEELMARLQKGQKGSSWRIGTSLRKGTLWLLARLVGDPTLAEDIFQSTFLQLYQKADQYEPGRAVRPVVYIRWRPTWP
jgi:RNA polymerase sigma-70 factor (ECF subfamily)